jgi:hypothetical protein
MEKKIAEIPPIVTAQWVKLNKKFLVKERECMYPGCKNMGIFSHVLQRKGLLNRIADSGELIMLEIDMFTDQKIDFIPKGINQILKFRGFCKFHDSVLFEPIETNQWDVDLYTNHLLLSYRALLCEIRKKEISIEAQEAAFTDKIFLDTNINYRKRYLHQSRIGVKDLKYYESILLSNLDFPQNKLFKFHVINLPMLEVCTSAVFSYESIIERLPYINLGTDIPYPLTTIFIHLFPYQNRSVLIIGHLIADSNKCKELISILSSGDAERIIKLISDILLQKINLWCMSKLFFKKNVHHRKQKIISTISFAWKSQDNRRNLDFNLFN